MTRTRLLWIGLSILSISAVGCGGNGSGFDTGPITAANNTSQVDNGPDTGDLAIFLTSASRGEYDHAWVLVKKVELKLATGGTRLIFDDAAGVGIDLSSLRDADGQQYAFLNSIDLPAGTYTSAQVTLGRAPILFRKNAASGTQVELAGLTPEAKEAVLNVPFDPPKMIGTGHDELVLDFDLDQWHEDKGKLTAIAKTSLAPGLESADRVLPALELGKVESVKGEVPQQTFTLKSAKTMAIEVKTLATTSLVGEPSPAAVSKGATVEVSGLYDVNTRRLDANSVRVLDAKSPTLSKIIGVVSDIDAKTGTWKLQPSQTRGFLPGSTLVSMTVTEGAKLYGASGLALGREEFLKGLSGDEQVSVLADGAYDSSKNIFTASTVRLQGENSTPGVKVEGLISDAKSTDQTFGLTLTGYEGLYSKPGAVATIAITPTTVFFDTDGKELPGEGFFAAIGAPRSATVSGTYDAATNRVLAASVKLGPMVEKPKPKAAKR